MASSQMYRDNDETKLGAAVAGQEKLVYISCKDCDGFQVGVTDGIPELVPLDHSDPSQKWNKVIRGNTIRLYSKDPAHPKEALCADKNNQVVLTKDSPPTVVWTLGKPDEHGFRTITKINSNLVWSAEQTDGEDFKIMLEVPSGEDKQLWKFQDI